MSLLSPKFSVLVVAMHPEVNIQSASSEEVLGPGAGIVVRFAGHWFYFGRSEWDVGDCDLSRTGDISRLKAVTSLILATSHVISVPHHQISNLTL